MRFRPNSDPILFACGRAFLAQMNFAGSTWRALSPNTEETDERSRKKEEPDGKGRREEKRTRLEKNKGGSRDAALILLGCHISPLSVLGYRIFVLWR